MCLLRVSRLQLGLVQPPAEPLPADGTPEWIELRPRWPLTGEKHAKSMPPTLSMKKPHKQAPSLTDMTREALAALQGSAISGSNSGTTAAEAEAAAAASC